MSSLVPQPPDALLGLIALFKADPRPDKIDLGVGVFRDATGATPVMRAVKSAEALLLSNQSSKSYLGAEGDEIYTGLLGRLVLGSERAASDRIAGIQTPGGTGALRLGAELIGRAWPDATVWADLLGSRARHQVSSLLRRGIGDDRFRWHDERPRRRESR
jgi:aromatic-amino-acid transaminase